MHELSFKRLWRSSLNVYGGILEMAMFEGLIREGSFKWFLGSRPMFGEALQEMEMSNFEQKCWVPQLSPIANAVLHRCSRILGTSACEIQKRFDAEASESLKGTQTYARNLLEYCCFSALSLSTKTVGYLTDKKFRRLMFLMMIAWEAPAADSKSLLNVDDDATIGIEAFSRIAPVVPLIVNVVTCDYLFKVLTETTGGRLQFFFFEKYLTALERAVKKLKSQTQSNLLASPRSRRTERILEVDGTLTTQPVLQHVGISAWPGRLTLTDHAFYFEALQVVTYEKAKQHDLSEDIKQVIKPELTGPLGARLFDRAILYKSTSLLEPIILEFPELMGHTRRDYWMAVIQEILCVHRFIHKFNIADIAREDVLLKAVFGITRLQAVQEITSGSSIDYKALLTFYLCEQLPCGDLILEALARGKAGIRSMSAITMASNMGFWFGVDENALVVGELAVGNETELERAIKESRNSYKKVVLAQATVDEVKVDGIDINLAVMQQLLSPIVELGKWVYSLAGWDDPVKSFVFCVFFSFIIYRGWIGNFLVGMLLGVVAFMFLTWLLRQDPQEELKIAAPPPSTRVDQLLALQNAVSRVEVLLQDGNVILLKLRALVLSVFPPASVKFSGALLVCAVALAFSPRRFVVLIVFLDVFTRRSPPRRECTDRWMRRLRDWWFSIPAAPVVIQNGNGRNGKKR